MVANTTGTGAHGRKALTKYRITLLLSLFILALVTSILTITAAQEPFLKWDVPLARGLQSLEFPSVGLAQWITAMADNPWRYVLLILTMAAAWGIGGPRAATVALPIFFCSWLTGAWLSSIVAQPRPAVELIHVVGHPTGYAYPSIFGLCFMATFGYLGLLAALLDRGALRVGLPIVMMAILIFGAMARVALGAHWPSDLLGSYLVGLFWILVFLPLVCGGKNHPPVVPKRR